MDNLKEFEQALMDDLEAASDKPALKDYTDIIIGLRKKGFIIDQILKKGIPVPIELVVKCRIDKGRLNSISEFIGEAKYNGLEIFPYGIPWPDIFRVNVILNNNRGI